MKKTSIIIWIFIVIGLIFSGLLIPLSTQNPKNKRIIQYYKNNIHNFNIINNDQKNINHNIVDLINKKLSTRMIYGPEVFSLNSIEIVNNKKNFEGEFNKNKIIFNTKTLNNLMLMFDEDIAEYIYQIIFHEYAHLISYNYFTNSTKNINTEIYSENQNRIIEPFSQEFISDFKKILKYDTNTKLYSKENVFKDYVSLGSVYNQKDLFAFSNGKKIGSYSKLTGNEIMSPINLDQTIFKMNINPVIKKESLEYLFSMDELFARKYQLINMHYISTIDTHNNEGEGFNKNGWINKNGKQFWSPYLRDVLNIKGGFNMDDEFLHDNPFKDKEELKKLFTEQFNKINDISIIWKDMKNPSKIKVGGYIPDESYKYIMYLDNSNKRYIPLVVEGNYYSFKDFINPINLLNKPLYFAKNLNDASPIKLKKVYNKFSNTTSSKRFLETNNINYKAIKNNNNNDVVLSNL